MNQRIHLSGFSLFKKERQNDDDLTEYKAHPALLDKLLIMKYIMLEEKERNKYIIQAQLILNNYIKGRIYTMAEERGLPLSFAHDLERKINGTSQIDEYKLLFNKARCGLIQREDSKGIQLVKRKKLNFIEFHSTSQQENQDLFVNLKQTLIEDFEFKNIEHFAVGGRQSFVSIVCIFEGSTQILYSNDRPIDTIDISSIVRDIIRQMKSLKLLSND